MTSCMEDNNSVSGQSYCTDNVTPKISTTDLQGSDDETVALASSVTMETNNNCHISSGHITQSSESVLDTCSTPEKWFHPFTGEMTREENILQPNSENDTQSTCQSEQRKRNTRESARANISKNARGEEWEMINEPHETLGVSENVRQTYFNNENVRDKNMVQDENAILRDKLERPLIVNRGVRCTDCFERVGKSTVNNFNGVEQQETIDVATKDQHVDSKEIGLGTSINQTTLTAQKCDEKQTMKENRHPLIMGDPAETEADVTQQTDDVFVRKEGDTLCINDDLKTSLCFDVQQEEAICGDLFYDQNKRTICSNEYLLELKNREPPEGSEEPYLSFYDDQQQIQHCIDRKYYNSSLYIEYQERQKSGFDYSETGSTQKDVEGSLNTDGNNINNQVSHTPQSLFPRSLDEVHCNSDDIVTNQTRVEFTGKWDVAPSLETFDNYNVILGFADDSFETRSVQEQRQRELYDLNSIENNSESLPRGTCPCRSKSNAGTANVEAHDLGLRADVRNVLLNLKRHQEDEKQQRSLFDGDTENNLPADAKIQLKIQQLACCRNRRHSNAGELEKLSRCGTPSFRAITTAESVLPDSRTGEQRAIGDERASVVTTFNRPFQETDNSQNSLAHVSTCFDSLIKGDRPEKSPWTLSTDTLTDIHDASHPGTALTVGKGLGSVCLPSLVRSNSEPILHLTSANHSEHSSGSRFIIVQEKGYGVNDLRERGRCVFDIGTSLDANHAALVCRLQERNSFLNNFDKQTPSEESQGSPIFSPNMDETRIAVKRREEIEQEPLDVRRQVFKVHTSIIQPCEKSKVRFSRGRGPKDKTSGLVSTNFTSSVTSFEGLSLPTNIKKASVITTLKHGSTRGRPKVVRIVTPNDNINDKSVTGACEGSRTENYFTVGRQSAAETQEMNMRLPNRLLCNQTYLVKIPPKPWRTKENKDEIFYPCDGYSCSESPSLVRPPKTSSLVTACDLVTSDLRFSPLGSQKNDPCPACPTKDTVGSKLPCVSSDDNPSTNQPQAAENESVAERLERITGYNSATKRNAIKPPLPRQLQNFINVRLNSGIRGRIASKRKQFLEAIQSSSGFEEEDDGRQDGELRRFEAFKRSVETERTRLITSTPDLVELERAVRSSRRRIDRTLVFKDPSQRETSAVCASSQRHRPAGDVWPGRLQKPTRYKQICRQEKTLDNGSKSTAYLETDIDTLESRLVCKTNHFKPRLENYTGYVYRARSMLTLADRVPKDQSPVMEDSQRARSMDFLLDDDNRLAASPPENTLNAQKTLSELELRIERSLENLNLPDWYKNSPWSKQPQRGIFLKRDEGRRRPRWQGLGSRTSSSTSLVSASFSRRYLTTKDHIFSTDWRSIGSLQSSRESLTGFSVGSVSPANSYPLSRWSSWRSSATSATVPGWSPYRSFRQPYLGWRAAAGHTSSSSFTGPPSPSTPPSNSRSASPGRILEDSKLTDKTRTLASPHRQADDVEESCLLTSLGGHLDRCDHSTGAAKKGPQEAPPPMYHLTGDTEMRNYHNGSYETGSSSYDFGKTGSPLQYPKVAYDSSPERQLSSSLQKDSSFQSGSPHFYNYSVRSGTSASSTNSPAVGTSYEEYPHRQSSPEEEFPFGSDLSLHPIHRIESANKETVHFHSTFQTERKINGISTAGRVESTFAVSEEGEPVQKSTLNGEGEWIPKEPSELSRSFMQEFHSWFQSMQEVDIQQGSSPPTQSTYCNSCIPDSTNTIEIRKPEVDDVQHHLTDGNQFKHQSQQSPLAQRVMWMESSFMKARPPTTVVVMATEESATEETNGSCPLSRNDDIYHEQYGPDGAVSS
ncbi:uncharacterized protein LOC143227981 [Tachypleus tridentatus]|uniref:uncharacterized protein LOC143227981 n=1 Tax=Tachypleus tridentatus TaxID=6853 RepID=UPI003FD446A6